MTNSPIAHLARIARAALIDSLSATDTFLRYDCISDDTLDDAANPAELAAFILDTIRDLTDADPDALLNRIITDADIDDDTLPLCIHQLLDADFASLDIPTACRFD